jgi:hypothetical protein
MKNAQHRIQRVCEHLVPPPSPTQNDAFINRQPTHTVKLNEKSDDDIVIVRSLSFFLSNSLIYEYDCV